MLLVLVAAIVAASVALVRGGSLSALAGTQFRWTWVLFASLLVQVAADIWAGDISRTLGVTLFVLSYVGVALFMLLNRSFAGMAFAAAGLALNALVIAVNGAMPVSRWAADVAGIGSLGDMGVKHEVAGPDTVLSFLGDVIPIPSTLQIISVGDVVLGVGIALLVYRQTLAEREVQGLGELPVQRL